ncbi:MAG TPA: hypothetical protein VKT24_03575 [Rhizomicrobium sp.]|nr:hypothetical protein [Rhizomicrobium sp.]
MSATTGSRTLPRLTIAQVTRIVRLGHGAAVALSLWVLIYPFPYVPLIASCFLLPILALGLAAWSKRASRWNESAKKKEDTFLTIVYLPLAALGARAAEDLNFLDWRILAAWSLIAGACILGAAYWRSARVRGDWRIILSLAFVGLVCSYGPLAFVNRELDPHTITVIPTTVYDKEIHTSGGPKGGSILFNVWVTPSPSGWTWIHVRRDMYWQLHVGQRACLAEGSGLLGIGWLEVRPCENA